MVIAKCLDGVGGGGGVNKVHTGLCEEGEFRVSLSRELAG